LEKKLGKQISIMTYIQESITSKYFWAVDGALVALHTKFQVPVAKVLQAMRLISKQYGNKNTFS
jgi:hypothetical protein